MYLTMLYFNRLHRAILAENVEYRKGYEKAITIGSYVQMSCEELKKLLQFFKKRALRYKNYYTWGQVHALRELMFARNVKEFELGAGQ